VHARPDDMGIEIPHRRILDWCDDAQFGIGCLLDADLAGKARPGHGGWVGCATEPPANNIKPDVKAIVRIIAAFRGQCRSNAERVSAPLASLPVTFIVLPSAAITRLPIITTVPAFLRV
jgi:hypothetical protein